MKISVITAAFNRVQTIGQAIDSVCTQNYHDVEHLIIDAQSKDGTLEEIERRRLPSMRVVSEPDEGIYDALNKGIRLASGEVIGVVHSDDFLAHDGVLAKIAAAFADQSVEAVYGDLQYVAADDTSRVVRHWRSGLFEPKSLKFGWMPPHPALFVRRTLIEIEGGYDTQYSIAADYDAILRWFGKPGIRTTYIPEVLVKMRVGGESNASFGRIFRKSREDLAALRRNKVGGLGTLACKNLRKVMQFVEREKLGK